MLTTLVPTMAIALRTAGFASPVGIDDLAPTLSWRISGPDGASQQAYQVLVAGSREALLRGEGDLWDSHRVPGGSLRRPVCRRAPLFWATLLLARCGLGSQWDSKHREHGRRVGNGIARSR